MTDEKDKKDRKIWFGRFNPFFIPMRPAVGRSS